MSWFKLLPHLIAWGGINLLLLKGFFGRKRAVALTAAAGHSIGLVGAYLLLRSIPGDFTYSLVRDITGGSFLAVWGVSVAAVYHSRLRDSRITAGERLFSSKPFAVLCSLLSGIIAGSIGACRLGADAGTPIFGLVLAASLLITLAVYHFERALPVFPGVSMSALMAGIVALLLFSSSFILRLDLFSPLSMKVMKFTHDFVHQFFESMLIPDHLFIRRDLWGYIGLLFGKEVGFWGGLVIWFTPVVLISLATSFQPLPQVAHIRQGAERRKVLAKAIRARRWKQAVPCFAFVMLGGGCYQSNFPTVEYWDPKPIPVTASPAGEIFIPLKGEVDLTDGKLHKYVFSKSGKEARFFVLMHPAGYLTVDLDACAICKPDGYGQAEGTVICYYCKTLIPLETVGKPGGCNPVPIQFVEKEDGVHLDALTLINSWSTTVQATAGGKERAK